jgi:hypothetical protein
VTRDLKLGLISSARARNVYGVVSRGDRVDARKTDALRRSLRTGRTILSVARAAVPGNALRLPTALVHPATARKAGLRAGEIGELLAARSPAAPIRLVVATSPKIARGSVAIAKESARFFRWPAGFRVWLRALPLHVEALQA